MLSTGPAADAEAEAAVAEPAISEGAEGGGKAGSCDRERRRGKPAGTAASRAAATAAAAAAVCGPATPASEGGGEVTAGTSEGESKSSSSAMRWCGGRRLRSDLPLDLAAGGSGDSSSEKEPKIGTESAGAAEETGRSGDTKARALVPNTKSDSA